MTDTATPPAPPAATPAVTPAPADEDGFTLVDGERVKKLSKYERGLLTRAQNAEREREEARAATTAAQDAATAAVGRARQEATAAAHARIISAEVKAAATRAGAHDPAALLKLLDLSKLQVGDDGEIAGVDELLTAAKAATPWAFSSPSATGARPGPTTASTAAAPAGTQGGAKHSRDMTPEEKAAELRKYGVRLRAAS